MSMITRYQKAGGFIQLLQLIETCGKQKQDNFLQMIEKEDIRWSQAIREKMLTIEKILSWQNSELAEIAGRLQELTLATALHGFKQEDRDRLLSTYTHSQKRNIEDLFKSKSPSQAEISSAFIKILQETRNMITHGYLRIEKFAPEMVLGENIEEKLGKSVARKPQPLNETFDSAYAAPAAPTAAAHDKSSHLHAVPSTPSNDAEINALRTRLQAMMTENNHLKSELHILKEKLSQIKKIA